ncbi:DegT/DnrJ/EryC1/StrS family aminotransferase [Salidesulfovibrio brasiliensis]|uniref:DegT/DnrJ/EryC1/StrS family aminotransferase n=1 Tax=Salidesulfovibrio brasiliensis TaxID=221711 RepID=UPI0006D263A0|nr:aminotransferase class I/II-fold pyridoxal phosphate-dependent enzyme [Salidesulfovibrio brasiliensis]
MQRKRIFLSPPHMGGTELDYVHQAFDDNYIAPIGPQLAEFERRFAELTGFSHAVGLASGTAALHLGLRCFGADEGDVVVASSLTFIGSVTPALFRKAEPVFIDSDAESWNMDPVLLAEALEALNAEGRRVAAVVPTDIYGQSCDLDRILDVCRPYDIPVLCDSAEAVGTRYKGRHAGCGARAATYSFNGNKIITTSGGGMFCTDDEKLAEKVRWLSQQARDPGAHYEHSTYGYNYRLSNVLAGIGIGQLEVLQERVERRRAIFDFYVRELGGLPGVSFMPEAPWNTATRWLSVILFDKASGTDPETVRLALEEHNIESRPVWKPMHMQPLFEGVRMFGGAVSEDLFRRGLCLPSGTAMGDDDLALVAETVRGCMA